MLVPQPQPEPVYYEEQKVERPSLKKPKVATVKRSTTKYTTVEPPEATAPQYYMEQPETNQNLKLVRKTDSELPE
jgi:hypothetical protein